MRIKTDDLLEGSIKKALNMVDLVIATDEDLHDYDEEQWDLIKVGARAGATATLFDLRDRGVIALEDDNGLR